MALVSISNVEILDNPAPFTNPFQFEITFECVAELKGGTCHLSSFFFSKKNCHFHGNFVPFVCSFGKTSDLEWKVVYVGSAESEEYDQVLDSILVGPIPVGVNKFVMQVCVCLLFLHIFSLVLMAGFFDLDSSRWTRPMCPKSLLTT